MGSAQFSQIPIREVEQFLYREARLLDERRFDEWLQLFTDDLHYWMSGRRSRYPKGSKAIAILDPDHYSEEELVRDDELSLFDETKATLAARVARLGSGMAWAEDPPSRTRHLIMNVEVMPAEKRARLGARLDRINPIAGTVFPNLSMLRASSRTIRVWHPRGPEETEVWSWVYVDKAAPPEVKEALRLAGVRVFGPSGTFEQDDMDNWQGCTETGRGMVARRHALNYEMGLGHERFDPDFKAWVSDHRYSESNHRQFYRRWAQLMAADRWSEIAEPRRG